MTCSVDDCEKPVKWRGLCCGHHHRMLRYGSATFRPAPRAVSGCGVEGCDGRRYGGGYCGKHYKRMRAHGDPLGGSTPKGAVPAFLRSVIESDTDECVAFPFARDPHGYGHMKVGGRYVSAHVFVAEEVLGPRPSPKHEVCHTCGNGAQGCVTKKHLYWGTRKQNVADAIAHGTALFWGVPAAEYSAYRASAA